MSSGFIGVLSRGVGLELFICDLINAEHYHRGDIPATRQGGRPIGFSVLAPVLLLGKFLPRKILANVFGFPQQCGMTTNPVHNAIVFRE
jgi:hypothetical protein